MVGKREAFAVYFAGLFTLLRKINEANPASCDARTNCTVRGRLPTASQPRCAVR